MMEDEIYILYYSAVGELGVATVQKVKYNPHRNDVKKSYLDPIWNDIEELLPQGTRKFFSAEETTNIGSKIGQSHKSGALTILMHSYMILARYYNIPFKNFSKFQTNLAQIYNDNKKKKINTLVTFGSINKNRQIEITTMECAKHKIDAFFKKKGEDLGACCGPNTQKINFTILANIKGEDKQIIKSIKKNLPQRFCISYEKVTNIDEIFQKVFGNSLDVIRDKIHRRILARERLLIIYKHWGKFLFIMIVLFLGVKFLTNTTKSSSTKKSSVQSTKNSNCISNFDQLKEMQKNKIYDHDNIKLILQCMDLKEFHLKTKPETAERFQGNNRPSIPHHFFTQYELGEISICCMKRKSYAYIESDKDNEACILFTSDFNDEIENKSIQKSVLHNLSEGVCYIYIYPKKNKSALENLKKIRKILKEHLNLVIFHPIDDYHYVHYSGNMDYHIILRKEYKNILLSFDTPGSPDDCNIILDKKPKTDYFKMLDKRFEILKKIDYLKKR